MLERPDFSAATDLYQVVDRVHQMQFIPVSPKNVLALAVTILVPFVPIALAAFPLDTIIARLALLLM